MLDAGCSIPHPPEDSHRSSRCTQIHHQRRTADHADKLRCPPTRIQDARSAISRGQSRNCMGHRASEIISEWCSGCDSPRIAARRTSRSLGSVHPVTRRPLFRGRSRNARVGEAKPSRSDRAASGPMASFLRLERGRTDLVVVRTMCREENGVRGPLPARFVQRGWGGVLTCRGSFDSLRSLRMTDEVPAGAPRFRRG
jgi:hypothetical protein